MLDAKLQLSDIKVDRVNFENQMGSYEEQFRFMVDERRNYESIFESLRTQIEALEQEKSV